MIKFTLCTSVVASAALTWRLIDPVGSYATLFSFSEMVAGLLPGGPVAARTVGLVFADQFVGFFIGVGFLSVLYLVFALISHSIRAVFRRKAGACS